jgi:hypothetical protein
MPKHERVREVLSSPPGVEYFETKAREGWKLVAVEWERKLEFADTAAPPREEVPFGMKVSDDCLYLVENPAETEALTLMLELLIADKSMSDVAEGLNTRGFRTRKGVPWTAVGVFELLPRIVEMAPRIYPGKDWSERRRRIFNIAGR